MEFKELAKRNFANLAYCGFAIAMLFSIALGSAVLLCLSVLSLLFAIVYSKSSHILNPLIARKFGMVLVTEGYRLSENLRVAIKETSSGYHALCVALMTPSSRITADGSKFEELLLKARFPFEFCLYVQEINPKRILDSFETKRRIKEIELSRVPHSKSEESSRIRRELSMLEGEIAQITKGSLPIGIGIRLKCSALGASEGEAANFAISRIDQLCSLFGASYNLSFRHLSGEELLGSIGG
ncbi:MAG: hypothetical protein KGH71_02290 [Candidatus Micrarchaeota archaeon]|nr:hypothetical protein [Candidatus Micrarchaeota archaeon]